MRPQQRTGATYTIRATPLLVIANNTYITLYSFHRKMWKPKISSYRVGYRVDDKSIVYDICHLANVIVLRNVALILVWAAPEKLFMSYIFLYLRLLLLSYFEQRGCDISHCSADIRCKMSWDIWTLPVPLINFSLSAILKGSLL